MEIANHTPFIAEALPFQISSRHKIMLLIVKGTFGILPSQKAVPADEQIPIVFADEFHDPKNGGSVKFESDIVPFKPRADIVLNGKAYAPHGKKVKGLTTSLTVAKITKKLFVIGNRHWQDSGGFINASDPKSFREMDLVYERAYGGADASSGARYADNPIGRGYIAKHSEKSIEHCLLPNIEDPDHPIQSWRDKPKPAGYGFTGKGRQARAQHLGTYDEAWQNEIAPDPPNDFRMDFYNGAPEDLQAHGYLRGNERVELVNLTPEGAINFELPGLKLDVQVEKEAGLRTQRKSEWTEDANTVKIHLDTLCLLPDEKKFYMVWRGSIPIHSDIEHGIKKLIISPLTNS